MIVFLGYAGSNEEAYEDSLCTQRRTACGYYREQGQRGCHKKPNGRKRDRPAVCGILTLVPNRILNPCLQNRKNFGLYEKPWQNVTLDKERPNPRESGKRNGIMIMAEAEIWGRRTLALAGESLSHFCRSQCDQPDPWRPSAPQLAYSFSLGPAGSLCACRENGRAVAEIILTRKHSSLRKSLSGKETGKYV